MPWKPKIISMPDNPQQIKLTCKPGRYYYDNKLGRCVHESELQPTDSPDTIHIITGECYKGWYEHIDTNPIYIESKAHLRRECEKRDVIAKAIMKPKSQGKGYEMSRR